MTKRLTILSTLILLIGVGVYFSNNKHEADRQVISKKENVCNELKPNIIEKPNLVAKNRQDNSRQTTFNKETDKSISAETSPLEYDSSSPYYIPEDAHKNISRTGLFNENTKKKIFEIRRKMIDRGFDARSMMIELKRRLQDSPNGKLSQEEIMGLLPEDLASDLIEIIHQINE